MKTAGMPSPPAPDHRRPTGRRFAALTAVSLLCACYAVLLLSKIPAYYRYLRDVCYQNVCERSVMTPLPPAAARHAGLSASEYAGLHIGAALLLFLVYGFVALLILRKRPGEPISWLAAVALVSLQSTSFIQIQWEEIGWAGDVLGEISSLSFILFLLLFPNGRTVSRPLFWIAVGLSALRNIAWYFPDRPWGAGQWPGAVTLLWMVLMYGAIFYSQMLRYKRHAAVTEKQQAKWVLYGLLLAFVNVLAVSAAPLLIRPDFYEVKDPVWMFVLDLAVQLFMLPIPVTLGISMLRKRLWDIDPIANRTLVYMSLSAILIMLYSLIVGYLSFLFRTGPNMIFSLAGAGLVAVGFAPLKEKLQRIVNRFIYGAQHDPYSVLEKLGVRLNEPSTPDVVLGIVVRTIKDSLRLPYVCIHLTHGGEQLMVAAEGREEGEAVSIPFYSYDRTIGSLNVCTRSPGEGFSEADWKMLNFLARQAATVVQGIRQAMEIQRLAGDLQDTREKLIFAREEERRAMRKNLHDDIAPRLAAMRLTSSLVVDWIRKDPAKAIEIVNKFKQDIGDTVNEIRGIVYDLRPSALDELGLSGAIRQRIEQIRHMQQVKHIVQPASLEVDLEAPEHLPFLPAAVEVGAYRIVTEALVNVAKHAGATRCRIQIMLDSVEQKMVLEIADNGVGLEAGRLSREEPGGLGLHSIRERAEELGGSCDIGPAVTGGTRVTACLPLKLEA